MAPRTLGPLCHYCGGPIRKKTETVYFKEAERPKNKQEAQRLMNQQIVSVSYWKEHVHKVTTWDGESYVDPYFCNGSHANYFAYVMARAGHCTTKYNEALKVRGT